MRAQERIEVAQRLGYIGRRDLILMYAWNCDMENGELLSTASLKATEILLQPRYLGFESIIDRYSRFIDICIRLAVVSLSICPQHYAIPQESCPQAGRAHGLFCCVGSEIQLGKMSPRSTPGSP